ncbi:DEAD/DEAH box helicase [Bacillus changyiensis]|uniref:DEAD/DEAH box helicase n=1 Tax=Bacillus changyiensis TaxID=3004103 RepID=UPI0037424AE3
MEVKYIKQSDQHNGHIPLSFSEKLRSFLEFRHLLQNELPFPDDVIAWYIKKGDIKAEKSIVKTQTGWICRRCGQHHHDLFAQFPCENCGKKNCVYCRSCVMMGRVSECIPLLTWHGKDLSKRPSVEMTWEGRLSVGQEKAAVSVVEAIRKRKELLIWAVCGSGKTELLFRGIEYALRQGLRLCIATPRTDVVFELAPRLKKAFKGEEITVLYGGSQDRGKLSPLVVSTTHQLMRYKEAFDVIIIDEVDAFPYSFDRTLQYATKKAGRQECARIYLTATPSSKMKRHAKKSQLPVVRIPARYHRQPLPEPLFKWCGNWRRNLFRGKIPFVVKKWLFQHQNQNQPVFLFVPSILVLESVVSILQKNQFLVEGVHAYDKNRKGKVKRFREGSFHVLVTTTILERGVTVKKAQVGVLGAEAAIFSESALVQMAGRAGRHPCFTNGEVYFFHFGITSAMTSAFNHIQHMNTIARKKKWID